ncbi:MAG: hypothetical protein IH608_02685 [Proteobacteria bacterium]|nr:hypothetical protein [Pseudomonadota bacterium]
MEGPRAVVFTALRRSLFAGLAILTFVGGSALWGLWVQERALRHLTGQVLGTLGPLAEVRKGLSQFEVAVLRFKEALEPDLNAAHRALADIQGGLANLSGKEVASSLAPVTESVDALRKGLERLRGAASDPRQRPSMDAELRALPEIAHRLDRQVESIADAYSRTSTEEGEAAVSLAAQVRLGVSVGLVVGAGVFFVSILFSLRRLQAPFQEILRFVRSAAGKDLTRGFSRVSSDELGALAQAASGLGATLAGTLGTLQRAAAEIASRGAALGTRAAAARECGETQIQRVEAGGRKARKVETTLEPVGVLAGELSEGAEQSASSVQQILAMTQQVRAEMEGLCQRVTSSATSMEELSGASTRVAALSAQVGAAAQTVAASAATIDQATEVLSAGAGEGRQLTEDVVAKAEAGRASMTESLRGMERIRQAVDAAVQSFERLEGGLLRVGRVTQVIDDIAGRTNLLSLNAAIIAAQAGESGKAFGVVAGEIRSLAEKTGASTREIRAIVEGVVTGGRDAAKAVSAGAVRVAEGARQAQATGELLGSIHASAARAADRLREIEAAAAGQSQEAGRVADEILQVSQGVEQIAGAVRDQETRTRAVHANLTEIDLVARQTLKAADEQTRGTELITRTVVDVSDASERVKAAIAQVADLLRGLRQDLEALGDQARQDLEQVSQLEVEGEGLASLAGEIHQEVDTFRLPADGPA